MSLLALTPLFLAIVALPALPGLVELRRRRDDDPLPIDLASDRDPRTPGRRLRDRCEPVVHDLRVEAGIGVAVSRGDVRIARSVAVGAVACDGAAVLEPDAVVETVIDAERSITAGAGALLGEAAATGGTLELAAGARFKRLWGLPVVTVGDTVDVPARDPATVTIEDVVMFGDGRLSLPAGSRVAHDVVVRGDLRIGEGAVVTGSVKAYGSIEVLRGARIEGTLIARKHVRIDGDVDVVGNVFAEGDVSLGPGTTVGAQGGYKTVFAGRRLTLAAGVVVFGAVVAQRGGTVR